MGSLTTAVAIATHSLNRLQLLERCVDSVLNGTIRPNELYVVVDHNKSLEKELLLHLPDSVIILHSKGRGLSSARNTAVENASADLICFIDDDARADTRWIETLSDAFRSESVVGVGGRILPEYEESGCYQLPPELLWVIGATYRGHPQDAGAISRPIGANMAFRRKALLNVGGFLPEFGPIGTKRVNSNDELALSMKIRERYGASCIQYCPAAIVHHAVPAERLSWRYLFRRSWVEGVSKARVSKLGPSGSLAHDRRYLLRILLPSICIYAWRGVKGSRIDLQDALRELVVMFTVGFGFLFGHLPIY